MLIGTTSSRVEHYLPRSRNRRYSRGLKTSVFNEMTATTAFQFFFYILNAISVVCVIAILYWSYQYLDGFGLSTRKRRFNWHPLLTSVGFLLFYGNGLLSFRILRGKVTRDVIKILHATLNGIGGVISIVGLVAVFMYHIGPGFSNLYSLHSWIGLLTMILYEVNFVAGFLVFFVDGVPSWVKTQFVPIHIYLGVALIGLIVISFVSGFVEKALFLKFGEKEKYSDLPPQAILINVLGIIVTAFGLVAGFLVTYNFSE